MPKPKKLSRSARWAKSRRSAPTLGPRRAGAGRGVAHSPQRRGAEDAEQRGAIVGAVVRRGKHLEIDPLFQPAQSLLVGREGVKPRPGDLVVFAFSHGRRARVTKVIGSVEVLRDVLEGLLLDRLPQRGFSAEVLAAASASATARTGRTSGDSRHTKTPESDSEQAKEACSAHGVV